MANKKISTLTNSLTKSTVATNDLTVIADTSASESKKMTYGELMSPTDANFRIAGSSDNTKLVAFEVDGLTTATTRTLTVPDADMTLVGTDTTQTLTNKTLTSPQVNFGSDANGDISYRNGSGVTARLPIGSTDQILAVQSGLPAWIANPSATAATSTTAGIVELATTAETETGTDATRAVTPDGLHDMTTLAGAAWFLDEDTMSSDSATKTASQQSIKAYVDNNIKYTPNTLPTYTGGYYTYTAPFLEHLDGATYRWSGWTATTFTPTALTGAAGHVNFTTAASGSIYSVLPGFTSSHTAGMYFSYLGSNFVSIKGRFNVGLGSSPKWGFGFMDDANAIYNAYNSTANDGARFIYDGTTLYCATSDTGVGATTNTITGVTITDSNIYQIDMSSTSVKFYVNGVLKFTHTTNLPNATTTAKVTMGLTAGSASNVNGAPIIITMPLSAS